MAKILCVDDNHVNLRLLNLVLARAGHETVNADDGDVAIRLIQSKAHVFDAIFMDIHMPNINGIIATEIIRGEGCQVPIISVTAYDEPKYRDQMLLAGANSYILKPFTIASIHETLHQFGIYPTGTNL